MFALSAAAIAVDGRPSSRSQMIAVALLTAGAVACKETGVMLPVLLLWLVAFVPRQRRGSVARYALVAGAVTTTYLIARLLMAPPHNVYPDIVLIKNKLLTRPFGALGLGIHRDILQRAPWIAIVLSIAWPALFARAARTWNADVFRLLAIATGWVLLSVAPLWTAFFVSDTLEGSRYLYLGSSLWSIAVAALIANATAMRRLAFVSCVALIGVCALVVLIEQQPWRQAAVVRSQIVEAWAAVPSECDPKRALKLPDTVAGAYVFRNGFAEAVGERGTRYSASCSAEWNGSAFSITGR